MVVFAAGVFAQGKPDFTGKWTADAEKTAAANPNAMAGGGGGGGRGGGNAGGGAFEVKQDATSLTRIGTGPNGPTETKYTLDGAAHDVTMGQGTAKVTAKVDGATIVIETTQDRNGTPTTTKAVWSMEGGDLVIATTRPGRGGGDPTTTKAFFKKG
jgi:hypothetical protein